MKFTAAFLTSLVFFISTVSNGVVFDNNMNTIRYTEDIDNYNKKKQLEYLNQNSRGKTCDPKATKEALKYLHILGDNITNNASLQTAIIETYGGGVWEEMVSENEYLKVKKGKLDKATINWIIESILEIDHQHLKSIIIPFSTPNKLVFEGALKEVMGMAVNGFLSSKIVFMTTEMKEKFIVYLLNTDVYLFSTEYADSIATLLPNVPFNVRRSWGKKIYYDLLKSSTRTSVAQGDVALQLSNIDIWGHGVRSENVIHNGDLVNPELYSASELIAILIKKKIIHNKTKIKITTCDAATGCENKPLPFSELELKNMYLTGELHKYFLKQSDGSFLHAVRDELDTQSPHHEADVMGYFGSVMSIPQSDTLQMDGTKKLTYAVQIKDNNENLFLLNRSSMKVTIPAKK